MMHLVGAIVYYIATSKVLLLDYTLVLSTVSVVFLLSSLFSYNTVPTKHHITLYCCSLLLCENRLRLVSLKLTRA